jgi:hypothetical protein
LGAISLRAIDEAFSNFCSIAENFLKRQVAFGEEGVGNPRERGNFAELVGLTLLAYCREREHFGFIASPREEANQNLRGNLNHDLYGIRGQRKQPVQMKAQQRLDGPAYDRAIIKLYLVQHLGSIVARTYNALLPERPIDQYEGANLLTKMLLKPEDPLQSVLVQPAAAHLTSRLDNIYIHPPKTG